ncbi:MAG TPA: ferritin-like domain-containing protein [Gemmatimonadaceae bacterium]|nr:ferritin-like domain-containing protein [Gemmatimonadaceae bacterium]
MRLTGLGAATGAAGAGATRALSARTGTGSDGGVGRGAEGAGAGAGILPLAHATTPANDAASHARTILAIPMMAGSSRRTPAFVNPLAPPTRYLSSMRIEISDAAQLHAPPTRRDFLRLVGAGGALLFLPGLLSACGSDAGAVTGTGAPGSGEPLVIDFSRGDVAVLQFALVLEQLEADFYSRIVAAFASSGFSIADQAVLSDIANHEVVHRELLSATLGADGSFAVSPTYGGLDFTKRADVLARAKAIEDLGVATYDGVAQYLQGADSLALLARIVSVEGRHAAVIRDLLDPLTGAFAPGATDDLFSPPTAATALQGQIVDRIGFLALPAGFVDGPNANG